MFMSHHSECRCGASSLRGASLVWRIRARGRGVRKPPGVMNRLESAYAQHLALRRAAGEVEWFAYEAVKLRLADKTFLTVDFFLMLRTGELEAHECKGGHIEDDAAVKLKVAASIYPFRFVLVRRAGPSGWSLTDI